METRRKLAVFVAALIFAACSGAYADLKVADIFNDNMVLQRGKPISVWGSAKPKQRVFVRIAGQIQATTADNAGKWRLKLAPIAADNQVRLMTITTSEKTIILKNILIGEVWFCSGESGMAKTLGQEPAGSCRKTRSH